MQAFENTTNKRMCKRKEEQKDQVSYLNDLAKTPDALKHLVGGTEKILLWILPLNPQKSCIYVDGNKNDLHDN